MSKEKEAIDKKKEAIDNLTKVFFFPKKVFVIRASPRKYRFFVIENGDLIDITHRLAVVIDAEHDYNVESETLKVNGDASASTANKPVALLSKILFGSEFRIEARFKNRGF